MVGGKGGGAYRMSSIVSPSHRKQKHIDSKCVRKRQRDGDRTTYASEKCKIGSQILSRTLTRTERRKGSNLLGSSLAPGRTPAE